MDWSSIAGIVVALTGLLAGQALEGGSASSLLQPTAFLIVIFGTVGAVLVQSKMRDFLYAVQKLQLIFIEQDDDRHALFERINVWSLHARRRGRISLQDYLVDEQDPFISKGLTLLVDNIPLETIHDICSNEMYQWEAQERRAIKIWESAGGYAPTMGILGAVTGLIQVMQHLEDPSQLGSGIAVAFVATIYGIGFANIVFLPMANKMKTIMQAELVKREMFVEGLSCIYKEENSMMVNERLSSYLRGRNDEA